jgi:predicted nucleic acid-binding protein
MMTTMKARVYIETSVVSYLKSRLSTDLVVAAHQELTRRWWSAVAPRFEMLISELVQREASAGDITAAGERLEAIAALRILTISEEAALLAEHLVERGLIPREHIADALHVAIAAVNGVDYLLTSNCKHLANAAHRGRIEWLVAEAGYTCPVICTPEELMED